MTIEQRKEKFVLLGNFFSQFPEKQENRGNIEPFYSALTENINRSVHYNGWFTRENILFAIKQWSCALTRENLDHWLRPYQFGKTNSKTVGIIMAGNIPLVGLHDFLSVLISGHKVLVKQSSNDKLLLPVIADYLISIAPEWKDQIEFVPDTGEKMKNFDAIIATGSNNTARYFEYYFRGKPSIIRKNRNSVAVLTGKETREELSALGEDIFRYFGLGCRNVSKLYIPENYDFDPFFETIFPWGSLINNAKYANNYDYNKAVYLMSEFKLLDNGFLILKEDENFGSPIATLFYEKYRDQESLKDNLESKKEEIQCIVSRGFVKDEVAFGKSQAPQLWDYADGVDTLDFLKSL